MREGWFNEDYLILAETPDEAFHLGLLYGIDEALPQFHFIGLSNWSEFLVQDSAGNLFKVPTVPLDASYLQKSDALPTTLALVTDERIKGRIRWFIQPMVFGGDPSSQENTTWLPSGQHAEAVRWWNKKYKEVRSSNGES